MSKPLLAGRELLTRPLGSMVSIDSESLPLGTNPSFEFHYFDISCAANGRLQIPDTSITYAEAPSRARRIVRNGDVLMSTVRPNLKAFAYCNMPEGSYIASTGFAVLRAIEGNDPRYILYSILSDDVARQIESYVVGSNYPAINSSDVKRLQIPDWKPSQQRRIAEILSTVDEAIEQTEALIAKYQQVKAGLMQDLFTRGVTPDGHLRPTHDQAPHRYKESPLGWIPKEWEFAKVGSCINGIDAGKSPDCPDTPASGDQWGVLKVGAIDPEGLREKENKVVIDERLKNSVFIIHENDLLFSRANTVDLVGLVCHLRVNPGNLMLSDKTLRLRPITSRATTRFLFHSLQTSRIRRQIENLATGTSGSMKNISQVGVESLQLVLPRPAEQAVITDRIDALVDSITVMKGEAGKLRQQKKPPHARPPNRSRAREGG